MSKLTQDSFNMEWGLIPKGQWMLSNPKIRERITKMVYEETKVPLSWFKGKRILDHGCGSGRWSYAFKKLGAKEVVSVDFTKEGCRYTKKWANPTHVIRADVLHLPLRSNHFDMLFSFGVIHHTQDADLCFSEMTRMVKKNGYLYTHVYGFTMLTLRVGRLFLKYFPLTLVHNTLKVLTRIYSWIPLTLPYVPFTKCLHTNFDAYAPKIADNFSLKHVMNWFKKHNFTDITRTKTFWDAHYVRGTKT